MTAITDADPRAGVEKVLVAAPRDEKPMDVMRGLMIGGAISASIWGTVLFLLF